MMDQKLTRRGFLEGSGLAALMVVGGPALLSACGATTSSTKGSSSLRIGLLTDQDTLNPFTSVDAPELFRCVYDNLMAYDAHLNPQLQLAKTKTASADGKTLTYTLQPGAKFHDGTPVTSADVKFSYDLVVKTGLSGAAFFIHSLVSTAAPDPNTFVATFSNPPADDPGLFVPIVPQHIWGTVPQGKVAAFTNDSMIGSGPFKFVEWKHGQSWKIERNPDYWGTKAGLEFGQLDRLSERRDPCPRASTRRDRPHLSTHRHHLCRPSKYGERRRGSLSSDRVCSLRVQLVDQSEIDRESAAAR